MPRVLQSEEKKWTEEGIISEIFEDGERGKGDRERMTMQMQMQPCMAIGRRDRKLTFLIIGMFLRKAHPLVEQVVSRWIRGQVRAAKLENL